MAESALDALLARDAEERRRDALHRASLALDALVGLGIDARLVGSLDRGGFARHSDIDILILACPPDWRYRLESVVEGRCRLIPQPDVPGSSEPEPRQGDHSLNAPSPPVATAKGRSLIARKSI